MTSIPLSDLPVSDEIRRDRWGRYLCRRPGETKLVGHTRVTTVAKALDDGGGLAPWKATHAVVGTIMRRGLRSQWEALMAATGDTPWYHGVESKKRCKELVEQCCTAAGADERRDTGISLHTLTALHDLGREPTHLTEESERDLKSYADALFKAGVEIMPELVEQTVVLDDYQVAGTFDRGAKVMGFDRPLVADLKSGGDLSYSWPSIAVQLAAYSRANSIYRQGPALDGSEDVRLPMPDFDKDNGLIVWLDSATGECTLHLVDIAQGWEAFQLSMAARAWRKANVSMPLGTGRFGDELVSELEASVAALAGVSPDLVQVIDKAEQTDVDLGLIDSVDNSALLVQAEGSSPEPGRASPPGTDGQVRDWLQRRIDVIGAHANAKLDLTRSWPVDGRSVPLPTLIRFADHTPAQLEAIETVLTAVERRHRIPWPEPKPGVDLMAMIEKTFPGTKEQ